MPALDVFWWGTAGGFAGYLLVYVLPLVRALSTGEAKLGELTLGRIVGFAGLALICIALGGVTAMMVQAGDLKEAVVAGIGFEGILRGSTAKYEG